MTSVFLGHGTAVILFQALWQACSNLGLQRLLQLSMDGPNVNWALHGMFQKKCEEEWGHSLLNVGSCGLHVVHNALRGGHDAAEWNVEKFLSCLYYLLKDSPARRADFLDVSCKYFFIIEYITIFKYIHT